MNYWPTNVHSYSITELKRIKEPAPRNWLSRKTSDRHVHVIGDLGRKLLVSVHRLIGWAPHNYSIIIIIMINITMDQFLPHPAHGHNHLGLTLKHRVPKDVKKWSLNLNSFAVTIAAAAGRRTSFNPLGTAIGLTARNQWSRHSWSNLLAVPHRRKSSTLPKLTFKSVLFMEWHPRRHHGRKNEPYKQTPS